MEVDIVPRWLLTRLGIAPGRQPHVALLLSSVLALLAGPLLARLPHLCLAQTLLNLPCPGCGVLHSLGAVRALDLAGAWHANPAGILLALLFVFQIVARPLALACARTADGISSAARFLSAAAVAALLSVWVVRLLEGGLHGSRYLLEM